MKPTHLIKTDGRVLNWTPTLAKRTDMTPAVYDEETEAFVPLGYQPVKPVPKKPNLVDTKPNIIGPTGELPPAPGANIVDEAVTAENVNPKPQVDKVDDVSEDSFQQITKSEIVKSAKELLNVELDATLKKDDLIREFRKAEKEHFDALAAGGTEAK